MAEDVKCIRNKYDSNYKKVLITIFHHNNFTKRDINGVNKRHSLLVESVMFWFAHFLVNLFHDKSSFSQPFYISF